MQSQVGFTKHHYEQSYWLDVMELQVSYLKS